MKGISSFGILITLLTALILLLALTNFNTSAVSAEQLAGAAAGIRQTTTPTPIVGEVSEIGSTNGILIMGVVIVLIVTLPLLFHKGNHHKT